MKIKVKLDYVYISCDVMINIYSEIKEKDLDVHIGWIYDLSDQIEGSLDILKKYENRYYKELQEKYKKIESMYVQRNK